MNEKNRKKLSQMKLPKENVIVLECKRNLNGVEYKEYCAVLLIREISELSKKPIGNYTAIIISGKNIGEKVRISVTDEDKRQICVSVGKIDYTGNIDECSFNQFEDKLYHARVKDLDMNGVWCMLDGCNARCLSAAQAEYQKMEEKRYKMIEMFKEIEELTK